MQHAASTLTLHCTLGGSSDTFFHLYLFSPLARTILVRSEFNKPPSLHLQACACMCASVNVRKESFSSLPCADCWVSKTSKSHTVNNEKEKSRIKDEKKGSGRTMKALNSHPKKKWGEVIRSCKKKNKRGWCVGDQRKIKSWWMYKKQCLRATARTLARTALSQKETSYKTTIDA